MLVRVGFDVASASRLQLENGCSEDIETVDYTLTSGSFSQTASSTNLFRYADFPAVPTGQVTVTAPQGPVPFVVDSFSRTVSNGRTLWEEGRHPGRLVVGAAALTLVAVVAMVHKWLVD